ncbi:CRAL-TRIO domain-containing protein [Cladorrhinum sp. PSN332]|nr:CRAL-TRIO domain-containing protein [Cladorrhinum sp. PSN332]
MAGAADLKLEPTLSVGGHDIGYPHGHLGHLNAEEEKSLEQFRKLLQEKGLYVPGEGERQASHDDQTLLRFLRARKWVPADAFQQFKDTEEWRKSNQLDVLYDTIDVDAYEETRSLYPQWTGRRDRRGIPLYLFQIRHLDAKTVGDYEKKTEKTNASKAQSDGSTPQRLLRLFALYENLTRFAQPLCTEMTDRDNAETPITLSTNIVDVSQVSLRMFWNLKSHMQIASTLATAHYPETLDRIFVIGAPYFFSTVWGWIKRWFDPLTVSKIFILSPAEVKSELERFIEPQNLPKAYGGQLDFDFHDRPNLDPHIVKAINWENGYTTFPEGPVRWRPVDGGRRLECVALGYKNGVQREERVGTIAVAFPKGTAAAVNGTTPDKVAEAIEDLTISEKAVEAAASAEHKTAAVQA